MSAAGAEARAALPELIRGLLQHGRHAAASAARRDHAEFLEGQFDAALATAQAFAEAGDAATAEPLFRAALRLRPGEPASYLGLAEVLRAQGRHPEALEAALLGRAAVPGDPRITGLSGHLLLEAGRAAEAETALREALPGHPDPGWTRMGLSNALASQGRFGEAVVEARLGLAAAPRDPGRLFWLGHLLRSEGDTPAAADLFRSVLELEPDHPLARQGLAEVEAVLAEAERAASPDREPPAAPVLAGEKNPAPDMPPPDAGVLAERRARLERSLALAQGAEPVIARREARHPRVSERLGLLARRLLRGA